MKMNSTGYYSSGIWDIQIDYESLVKAADCEGKGLTVHRICISDAALAVHVTCQSKDSPEETRKGLGQLLRFLAGRAEEIGFVLPVIGLVDAAEDDNLVNKDLMSKWAADQDWHRGDFSLIVLSDDWTVEDMIRTVLGGVPTKWSKVQLQPRNLDEIRDAFESERRAARVSADYGSLLEVIGVSLQERSRAPITKWLEERQQDVRRLIAEGDTGEQGGVTC